jgi:hypothetical protein
MPPHMRHVEREQSSLVEKPSRTGPRERHSVHGERRQRLVQTGPDRDHELVRCRLSECSEDAQDHGAYAAGVLGRCRVDQEHGEA